MPLLQGTENIHGEQCFKTSAPDTQSTYISKLHKRLTDLRVQSLLLRTPDPPVLLVLALLRRKDVGRYRPMVRRLPCFWDLEGTDEDEHGLSVLDSADGSSGVRSPFADAIDVVEDGDGGGSAEEEIGLVMIDGMYFSISFSYFRD